MEASPGSGFARASAQPAATIKRWMAASRSSRPTHRPWPARATRRRSPSSISVRSMSSRSTGSACLEAVRPLDQHSALHDRVVEPGLGRVSRRSQAIEIEMRDRSDRRALDVIGLRQRKGRARHVESLVAERRPDNRSRQGRFAGAEIAAQRNHIAPPQIAGDQVAEQSEAGLIEREGLVGGGMGAGHGPPTDQTSAASSSQGRMRCYSAASLRLPVPPLLTVGAPCTPGSGRRFSSSRRNCPV